MVEGRGDETIPMECTWRSYRSLPTSSRTAIQEALVALGAESLGATTSAAAGLLSGTRQAKQLDSPAERQKKGRKEVSGCNNRSRNSRSATYHAPIVKQPSIQKRDPAHDLFVLHSAEQKAKPYIRASD